MFSRPPARLLLAAAALFIFALTSLSQVPAPDKDKDQDRSEGDTIKLAAEEVSIPVTVRDRQSGNLVGSLAAKDFRIFEDGVEQQITYFTAERVPVNIVLLLDTSSSLQGEVESIKEAAWNFIQQFGGEDRFSVISFTDTVDLILDWTSDKALARRALGSLTSGKFTAFNDALYLAATEQLKGIKGRKAVIVLSDGVDNRASTTPWGETYEAAVRSEANVYVVSKTAILSRRVGQAIDSYRRRDGSLYVPTDHQEYYGKLQRIVQVLQTSEGQLTKLAEDSGGRIYLPLAATDLSTAYRQVADELKSQYLINYVPSNPTHDGRFRAVKIKIADAALRAYSRGGYYAPRDEQTVVLRRP